MHDDDFKDAPMTQWLQDAQAGDDLALARVWAAGIEELRSLAIARLARELQAQDLQATDIVNEAWIRMHGQGVVGEFDDRGMFFGAAWRVMGQLLIDHARTRDRKKRGGDRARVDFEFAEGALANTATVGDAGLEIEAAMQALAEHDPASHSVAVMKLCFGTDRRHNALLHEVDPTEIDRLWRYARTWLQVRLEEAGDDDQDDQDDRGDRDQEANR